MRRRSAVIAAATAGVLAAAWPAVVPPAEPRAGVPGTTAQDAAQQRVLVGPGDTIRVEGTSLGCQVEDRSGRVVIACRRAGRRTGTYTTILGERTAEVARFRSARTAKVVFTARHGGGARACRSARAQDGCP